MEKLIGFGLAGFGTIGRTHLAAIQANLALHPHDASGNGVNAKPRAVLTRRPGTCAGLPFEKIYSSMEDLLADTEVKVLDICTPNNLHFKAAEAGLIVGKAVYCEKPLCHEQAEADKLCTLAKQTSLPNQCALTMRFRPMVGRMKDMLEEGAIGEPIHFRASHFHHSYLSAARPMSWRQDLTQSGGGAVMDLGIHILDLARYLLGNIMRLRAVSRIVHKTRITGNGESVPNNTDEYLKADLETENSVPGILECSRVSASSMGESFFEIFGTGGSLLLHGERFNKLTLNEAGGSGAQNLGSGKPGLDRKPGLPGKPGKYESELKSILPDSRQSMGAFIDGHAAAIKNIANWAAGLAPFSGTPTFEEAAKSQALVHACLRSAAADGQWERTTAAE